MRRLKQKWLVNVVRYHVDNHKSVLEEGDMPTLVGMVIPKNLKTRQHCERCNKETLFIHDFDGAHCFICGR